MLHSEAAPLARHGIPNSPPPMISTLRRPLAALCALSLTIAAPGAALNAGPARPEFLPAARGPLQGSGTPSARRQERPAPGKEKRPSRPATRKAEPSWPKLKFVRRKIAKERLYRLISKKPGRAAEARRLLLSYGPGVCPILLAALRENQKEGLAAELENLLDSLVTPEHAPLLVKAYRTNNRVAGRWILKKLKDFENPSLAPFFRKRSRDKDPEIALLARYALAGLGDLDWLPFLVDEAAKHWNERNVEIRRAGATMKGEEASARLVSMLREADDGRKVAVLRLLAVAGVKSAVGPVASLLDSSKHQVRVGAVNALRGLVDGDPPFRNLPVFAAIEEVKKWKRRVGR